MLQLIACSDPMLVFLPRSKNCMCNMVSVLTFGLLGWVCKGFKRVANQFAVVSHSTMTR